MKKTLLNPAAPDFYPALGGVQQRLLQLLITGYRLLTTDY